MKKQTIQGYAWVTMVNGKIASRHRQMVAAKKAAAKSGGMYLSVERDGHGRYPDLYVGDNCRNWHGQVLAR